jgi:hypothetical protein
MSKYKYPHTISIGISILKSQAMSKYTYPHTIGIGISMASNFKGMVQRHIYLLWKVVCLFCLSCQELQTMTPPLCSWYCWKALDEQKVHWGDLAVFKPTMWKWLNIEQLGERKFNKMKTKYFQEISASFWYSWKAFDKWDILEVISYILDLR